MCKILGFYVIWPGRQTLSNEQWIYSKTKKKPPKGLKIAISRSKHQNSSLRNYYMVRYLPKSHGKNQLQKEITVINKPFIVVILDFASKPGVVFKI